MVEIARFKAVTLSPALDEKERYVAPIYDTIDEKTYKIYAANRNNIIHATRRQDGADLDNFIEVADTTIKTLFQDRILEEREKESLYIYRICYKISDDLKSGVDADEERDEYTLLGIVALVSVDDTGREIMGHESVFDDNTEERYYLMKKCRMNFSPIMAEYNEDGVAISKLLKPYIKENLPIVEVKHNGTTHTLWEINDQAICEYIIHSLSNQKLMILDGHHRYTAACRLDERDGVKNTMMMLVWGQDPNLLLLPWHRCISDVSRDQLTRVLAAHTGTNYERYDEFIRAFKNEKDANSAVYSGAGFQILNNLDIFKLQKMIIDPLIEGGGKISFSPTIRDAMERVDQGRCTASFIVKPPDIGVIEEVATQKRSLPQKSTRFLPKVIEGIILRRF